VGPKNLNTSLTAIVIGAVEGVVMFGWVEVN